MAEQETDESRDYRQMESDSDYAKQANDIQRTENKASGGVYAAEEDDREDNYLKNFSSEK